MLEIHFPPAVYFDVGVTGDSLEVKFSLVGSTTERRWNILVSQMACTDPWRCSGLNHPDMAIV